MKKSLLLTIMIMASAIAGAQIIHVPGDYGTIQEGIDAAQFFGDTVLVAEGTWYENIDFNGKFITVASEFALDGDTNHINNTIINGSQPTNPNYGSVVYFHSGEDTNSVLCGFTITGGTGIYVPALDMYGGGGIGIENYSGAKIINNHIEYNTVEGYGGSGGGIGAGDANNTNYVVIKNNRICNNSVIADGNSEGGGMAIFCNAIIKDNIVCNNLVTSENKTAVGGGIRVIGYTTERFIECTGNLIANNEVYSNANTEYAGAGGLQVFQCHGKVSNNIIKNNMAQGALGSIGGAILNAFSSSELIFESNMILDNRANPEEIGGKGGGLYIVGASPVLVNNMVCNNYASLGGGMYTHLNFDENPVRVINNTIAFNQEGDDGGGIYLEDADIVILNTILWGNDNYEGNEISLMGDCNVEVAYSDVSGGYTGISIFDDDPLFVDEVFHIAEESPCKDMGVDQVTMLGILVTAPDHDFEGNPRPCFGGFDIGADECDYNPYVSENVVSSLRLFISPNPSAGLVNVKYEFEDASTMMIRIYDTRGHEVFSKYIGYVIPGEYHQQVDLSHLPDGMYMFRIYAEEISETSKIIIRK